jgi:hypothetical protein
MASAHPHLQPGRVYRTRDLSPFGANPPRLAKRLVRDGLLVPLAHGLFAHPKKGRFGPVPPTDAELVRAFLDGGSFVVTGPPRWNALGLDTTALFAAPRVYNTKRSGTFELGRRRFVFRRVAFPEHPSPEWFVVDLFENAASAGTSRAALAVALTRALSRGAFRRDRLLEVSKRYGVRETRQLIERALEASAA